MHHKLPRDSVINMFTVTLHMDLIAKNFKLVYNSERTSNKYARVWVELKSVSVRER